jgi:hypothetical protein
MIYIVAEILFTHLFMQGNKNQCSRIPRHPWQLVNVCPGKVDFQTLVVCGQVNFNDWTEQFISNYF